MTDHCSEAGARALGKRITAYWADLGYPGVVCLIQAMQPRGSTMRDEYRRGYALRSNMINGLPPGYIDSNPL